MSEEQELVLDPRFFLALREVIPGIGAVQIQPKRGCWHNELTKFRYDVTLHVGQPAVAALDGPSLDWCQEGLTLAALQRLLESSGPEQLVVRRIPNGRFSEEVRLTHILEDSISNLTVRDLRSLLKSSEVGIDPEALCSTAEQNNYRTCIWLSDAATDGSYDLLLRRCSEGTECIEFRLCQEPLAVPGPCNRYGNSPTASLLGSHLVPDLQSTIRTRLPEYMCPSAFVLMNSLPLSANGKVDRRALSTIVSDRPELEHGYVAPRSPVEEQLAGIWAAVLKVDRIGVHDNFFNELGGHSLLATQLVARIRDLFNVELPLRSVFEDPTVAALAARIEAASQQTVPVTQIPIGRATRERTRIQIADGGVLKVIGAP